MACKIPLQCSLLVTLMFDNNFDGPKITRRQKVRQLWIFVTSIGLQQLNCKPNKYPAYIELVVTDQPNLVLDRGTRPSSDSFCHHQIIHYKVNFRIPPPHKRKIWYFSGGNIVAIKSSMVNIPWLEQLTLNRDHNWKVKTFTDTILCLILYLVM